jgi:hypothetical protein
MHSKSQFVYYQGAPFGNEKKKEEAVLCNDGEIFRIMSTLFSDALHTLHSLQASMQFPPFGRPSLYL